MELSKYKAREVQPTVLRLHPDLRAALEKLAAENNRSLTKEIQARLLVSVNARGPTLQGILAREADPKTQRYSSTDATTVFNIKEKSPAGVLSDTDQAMLEIFRAMPVEKQLALLSLFR